MTDEEIDAAVGKVVSELTEHFNQVPSEALLTTFILGTREDRLRILSVEPHEHEPKQHRDGRPPWCNTCGLTKAYKKPESRWEKRHGIPEVSKQPE